MQVGAELFVDTSAWYPIAVAGHRDHAAVASVLADRVANGARIVTTNLIVAETHALLLTRIHRRVALEFVRTVRLWPNDVVNATVDIEQAALTHWLERYGDQDFSFADAVSFAVMSGRGIREALTLDRHFAAAGFVVMPAA